jgi:long-chain acyl-CoA synthetase
MSRLPLETLVDFVRTYAANGDEVAVRQSRGYRMKSWSYAKIATEANRVARELSARGLVKGDTALLWGANSGEWIAAFLGCMLQGVVAVPMDDSASPDFVCRVCREVNAKVAFHSRIHKVVGFVPSILLESLCEQLSGHDASPYRPPQLSRNDTFEIIFTSGTTAEPRGVVITHGNILANIEPLRREIAKYSRYEKLMHPLGFLNLLPLSHVFGQMLGIFIPPMLAATVVFGDSLKPSDVMETIRRERVSVLVAVPRFIESLQREIERREEHQGTMETFRRKFAIAQDEHFLRRWWRFRRIHSTLGWKFWAFISGGAALPEQAETFWRRLGYAVIQGYGMTETTSLISLNHPFRSANGSIGRVFHGVDVRIDENGEVLVRGENVAVAYQQNGRVQSLAETDGWFRTGDLAERDGNGRLFFKGRRKNVIVTPAGMNVYPEDLEKALRVQPGVRDCVVLGIERDGNAEPCAVLLLNGNDLDPVKVVEAANRGLVEYQHIREWVVWPEPDFPRTPTQKPVLPRIREGVEQARNGRNGTTASQDGLPALISRIVGRSVPLSSKDANLETDLQLSSLDRVELLSALEQRHQIDLDEVEFQRAATVAQLEKLMARGNSFESRHVYPSWPQHWLVSAFRMAVYYLLAWPATYLLAAPRVHGRENLKGIDGPVLVVSNHVTYLDIAWILPALPARFRNRLATAMGGERLARMRQPSSGLSVFERILERIRYFLALSLFNVFPLPQQSGFRKSFAFAGDLVDHQWNLLVFPEGKTTDDGQMSPFRAGIGLLAKQLSIPVVPMYLEGLFDLKADKRTVARPGHVQVRIGVPVSFAADEDETEVALQLQRRVLALHSG